MQHDRRCEEYEVVRDEKRSQAEGRTEHECGRHLVRGMVPGFRRGYHELSPQEGADFILKIYVTRSGKAALGGSKSPVSFSWIEGSSALTQAPVAQLDRATDF